MPRRVDSPQPGFFQIKLVKNGPFVPCSICRPCACTVNGGEDNALHEWRDTCDRFPPLNCIIDGENRPWKALNVWHYGQAIAEETYELMLAQANWDRAHAPHAPSANPRRPIDLNKLPSLF